MALKAIVLAAVRDSFRLFWMSLVKVRNDDENDGSRWRRRRHRWFCMVVWRRGRVMVFDGVA